MAIVGIFPLTIQCIYSGGEDYTATIDRVLFTSGSIKDDRHCFDIAIIDDLVAEEIEEFMMIAQVTVEDIPAHASGSGSGQEYQSVEASIGGALSSSTGSISVTIVDNDGKSVLFMFLHIILFKPVFLSF